MSTVPRETQDRSEELYMASLVELAEVAKASYEQGGNAVFEHSNMTMSWTRGRRWENLCGFYAAEFTGNRNERVLAFRGTQDAWDVLVDDLAITLSQIPPQLIAALVAARSAGGVSCVTGHSLGGALALLVGAQCNLPAVTFNAPGVLDACVQSGAAQLNLSTIGRCASAGRVINIRIDGDAVSSVFATGAQVGRQRSYTAPQCGSLDLLCRHGIQTCISALRGRSESFNDLGQL